MAKEVFDKRGKNGRNGNGENGNGKNGGGLLKREEGMKWETVVRNFLNEKLTDPEITNALRKEVKGAEQDAGVNKPFAHEIWRGKDGDLRDRESKSVLTPIINEAMVALDNELFGWSENMGVVLRRLKRVAPPGYDVEISRPSGDGKRTLAIKPKLK